MWSVQVIHRRRTMPLSHASCCNQWEYILVYWFPVLELCWTDWVSTLRENKLCGCLQPNLGKNCKCPVRCGEPQLSLIETLQLLGKNRSTDKEGLCVSLCLGSMAAGSVTPHRTSGELVMLQLSLPHLTLPVGQSQSYGKSQYQGSARPLLQQFDHARLLTAQLKTSKSWSTIKLLLS